MGRAARAKQAAWSRGESVQRGNPEREPLRVSFIDATEFNKAPAHSVRRIEFKDRTYTMDERGQLRRAPLSIAPPTTTVQFTPAAPQESI